MILEQRQFLKGRTTFELLPAEVRVTTSDSQSKQQFNVDLANLSAKTARFTKGSIGSLVALFTFSAIYAGGCVAIFYGLRHDPEPISVSLTICGVIGLVMLPLIFTSFSRWRRLKFDVTTFFNRWSGQVILNIANDVPNPAEAGQFMAELTKRIERAAPVETAADDITGQLARLGELHRKGVLNDAEFGTAKERLLAVGVKEKRIGFQ